MKLNEMFTHENHRFRVDRIFYPTEITHYTVYKSTCTCSTLSGVHEYSCTPDSVLHQQKTVIELISAHSIYLVSYPEVS